MVCQLLCREGLAGVVVFLCRYIGRGGAMKRTAMMTVGPTLNRGSGHNAKGQCIPHLGMQGESLGERGDGPGHFEGTLFPVTRKRYETPLRARRVCLC